MVRTILDRLIPPRHKTTGPVHLLRARFGRVKRPARRSEQFPESLSPKKRTDGAAEEMRIPADGDSATQRAKDAPSRPAELEDKRIIEALLFAADRPLSTGRIGQLLDGRLDGREVRRLVMELREEYEREGRAFQIEEIAEGFKLLTTQEFHPYIARLRQSRQHTRLSEASLVTLAIIAYKQPISRAEIEVIRGVQSGQIVRQLMQHGLVKIVGRANEPGRPMLYGTTRYFLDFFGLKSIKDLPSAQELKIREGDD